MAFVKILPPRTGRGTRVQPSDDVVLVGLWGKGRELAIRLPAKRMKEAGLEVGSHVSFTVGNSGTDHGRMSIGLDKSDDPFYTVTEWSPKSKHGQVRVPMSALVEYFEPETKGKTIKIEPRPTHTHGKRIAFSHPKWLVYKGEKK